jgi:hypothetical protein
MANQTPAAQQNPWAANAAARHIILRGGYGQPPARDMLQPLNPLLASAPAPGSVVTIPLRNVGLVKRVLVHITGTITAGATSTQTLTKLGLANLISNVTFTDLGNNQRINTPGWHLVAISSAKRRKVWGSAVTTDTPFGYGNNYLVQRTASSIAANGNTTFSLMLDVPFAVSDHDLAGAIWADTTQATMQISMTFNPSMFVASTADPTLAVYQSGGSDLATLSNVAVQVYQNYLDDLPINPQTKLPVLPVMDLATAYLLNQTPATVPVAGQDNAIPFVNNRRFLSLIVLFDNGGTLNVGSDINYFSLTSANFTAIQKTDAYTQAFLGRNRLGDDFPAGMYYWDFRDNPIDTNVSGNMQLLVNPSSVAANSQLLLAWEQLGLIGLVNQGGSLYAG